MIKALCKTSDGRDLLMIGLSFKNLEKFKTEVGDTFIKIDGKEMGVALDIIIFSGETEQQLARQLAPRITEETNTHFDPRLVD